MDSARHQNLHTIIMLKDVIRKWWRCELGFANKAGEVLDWKSGEIVAPPNDLCRLALFSEEGLRRCSRSVRELHDQFQTAPTLRHARTHECHQGFTLVGAPLYLHGEYEGFFFVEGFATRPLPLGAAAEPGAARSELPAFGPADLEKLTDVLEFCVGEIASYEDEMARKDERIQTLASELSERYRFENLIGGSSAMREVFEHLSRVTHADTPVLLEGEIGTGKELVARALHYNGPRKDRPFVVQSCAALDDQLLDRALFGYVKGAFPGAIRDKKGLFTVADGGTIFLDQIARLSLPLQEKLLRVIDEGTSRPVGGETPRVVDVRVIAATNVDLAGPVQRGEFLPALRERLGIFHVSLPPLRERRDDIPVLVEHFLRKHHHASTHAPLISPEALAVLTGYGWPGNIRELENEVERLLVLGSDLDVIPEELVSARIRNAVGPRGLPLSAFAEATGNLNEAVEQLEREMIRRGLVRTGNNKSQLARELGISRSNLILKIAKYGLDRAGSTDPAGGDGTPQASTT